MACSTNHVPPRGFSSRRPLHLGTRRGRPVVRDSPVLQPPSADVTGVPVPSRGKSEWGSKVPTTFSRTHPGGETPGSPHPSLRSAGTGDPSSQAAKKTSVHPSTSWGNRVSTISSVTQKNLCLKVYWSRPPTWTWCWSKKSCPQSICESGSVGPGVQTKVPRGTSGCAGGV